MGVRLNDCRKRLQTLSMRAGALRQSRCAQVALERIITLMSNSCDERTEALASVHVKVAVLRYIAMAQDDTAESNMIDRQGLSSRMTQL